LPVFLSVCFLNIGENNVEAKKRGVERVKAVSAGDEQDQKKENK